ncbi:hypothetical protein [Nocardia sp. IFM 10818]
MAAREREVRIDVVLAVPSLGFVLAGLAFVVLLAAVVAVVVSASDFSDGTATIPPTPIPGACEPFCGVRSESVLPQGR